MGYWNEIFVGGWSLVEGMKVTFRRLFHPLVTVQYPRKRVVLSPAYRGHIEFTVFKETGTHKCNACGTCARMCPSNVITVERAKAEAPEGAKAASAEDAGQEGKEKVKAPKKPGVYVIDFTTCSLCGLCIEACPMDTLQFSREYELVGESRQDGVIDLLARLKEKTAATSQ
jgi:NADH-quinone oxidoreductase subunit I